MEVLDWQQPNHIAICEKCKSTLKYNKYDLKWTHTEDDYYYLICPVCGEMIWIPCSELTNQMYHEAWIEKHPDDKED